MIILVFILCMLLVGAVLFGLVGWLLGRKFIRITFGDPEHLQEQQ